MYRKGIVKIAPEDYILNPGYLKLDLMLKGLRIDDSIYKKGFISNNIVPVEGVVGGLDIILPENTWVNVSYRDGYVKASPYLLIEKGEKTFITNGEKEVEVRLLPPPEFYTKKTSSGIPFSRIGLIHGGYIAITPVMKCDFFNFHIECKYCSSQPGGDEGEIPLYPVDDVLETVEAAYREGKAGIVYITLGFISSPDGGLELLKPYIRAIKKNFNTLIALESLPPRENHWIDETYAYGVDSVIYNLEIFDPQLFEDICPGRARLIGRQRYLEALKYASELFPNGTVASHLIVGLEPPESTIKGIDFLTDIGVIPILPIFKPLKGSKLEGLKPPRTEDVASIYGYLYRTIKKKRINMAWVREISIVTTPFEGRFFVGEEGERGILKGIYNSRLRIKAAWSLATLRRKLRVREVGESLDSSGL